MASVVLPQLHLRGKIIEVKRSFLSLFSRAPENDVFFLSRRRSEWRSAFGQGLPDIRWGRFMVLVEAWYDA